MICILSCIHCNTYPNHEALDDAISGEKPMGHVCLIQNGVEFGPVMYGRDMYPNVMLYHTKKYNEHIYILSTYIDIYII